MDNITKLNEFNNAETKLACDKDVAMAEIDYKTAYMIPKICIIDFLKVHEISENVIDFITDAMKNWKQESDSLRKYFS